MKKLIIFLLVSSSLVSCAQKKTDMNNTIDSVLGNLDKTVQYRDQQINYHAGIHVGGCSFEFFINDLPVLQYFGDGNGTMNTNAPINPYILQSGKQRYKLVVYPAIFKGEQTTTLSPGVAIDITVEGLKFREDGVDNKTPKVQLLETPQKKDEKGNTVYADAGKPMAIYEGSFDAQVPYQLKGWTASKDLTREDTTALKAQVLDVYKNIARLISEHKTEELAQKLYTREKETAQALFYDHAMAENNLKDFDTAFARPGLEMQPLENYKLVFYGNKIVGLERTDIRGKSPLFAYYPGSDGRKKYKMYYCYLHKPAGSNELEVIR